MHEAIIILGGNLGDVPSTFEKCKNRFLDMGYRVENTSSIYTSSSWGYVSDSNYYNAILVVKSNNNPQALLDDCLNIEIEFGRIREIAKGYQDRTIDIDILFFDDQIISNKDLVIPHPRLHERKFCLVPLNEIMPNFIHPVLRKTMAELLADCGDESNITKG